MVAFDKVSAPLTESDVLGVERRLNIRLPRELRQHYLRLNGGRPKPNCYNGVGGWYCVQRFLPMNTGDRNIGFEETYSDLVNSPKFPQGYLPFAVDEGGDYFLCSVMDRDYGAIVFNQSEYYGDNDRFLVPLASSLSKFLEGLSYPS